LPCDRRSSPSGFGCLPCRRLRSLTVPRAAHATLHRGRPTPRQRHPPSPKTAASRRRATLLPETNLPFRRPPCPPPCCSSCSPFLRPRVRPAEPAHAVRPRRVGRRIRIVRRPGAAAAES
jgi:hypothetical protein